MKLLQKILFTALLLGSISLAYSNSFELTGVVKNVLTNEPVADHLVYIAPLSGADTIATTTDAEGYFYKQLEIDDTGMFLGTVITLDPCSGEMNYQVLAIGDSSYFVEFNLCGSQGGDCFAMFEYYNNVSSVAIGVDDSLSFDDYTVQFVNESSVADSYKWDFGDGTKSDAFSPLHTFPGSGSYDVSLSIKSDSCESTYTTSVWVDELQSNCDTWFSYSYGADSLWLENDSINDIVNPLTVQFFDYSMQENEYWNWNFGDGTTSTEKNPTHTFDKPGVHHVSLEAGNAECSSTSEQTLIIETTNESCNAAMEYIVGEYTEDDSLGIGGYAVEFIDMSVGNPDTWRWDFGDGIISREQNPVHLYESPGVYSVVLFAGNDSCFSTLYSWITVVGSGGPDSICMADFIVEYQDCVGDSLDGSCLLFPIGFHNISMGNFTEWYWDFGDGEISTEQNPVHLYEAGVYDIVLKAIGPDCKSEYYQSISINAEPIDSIWQPESCLAMFYPLITDGRTVEFVNESYGEIENYYWDFGDGTTSTMENPVHTYTTSNEWVLVILTIETADSCFSNFVMELWLEGHESNESLVALFIPEINGTEVIFHNESQGEIENIHWDFGDGVTADTYNATHIYDELGTYIVTLGISNNNAVNTFTLEIDLATSTFKGVSTNGTTSIRNNKEMLGKLSVSPNPVSNEANVNIVSEISSKANLQVLNLAGQTIMQKHVELVKGENNFSVSTELLKQGVYLLNVVTSAQTKSLKITK